MSNANKLYNDYLDEIKKLIPRAQYDEIMSQDMCELEFDFMGFLDVYKPLSLLIPKGYTIIDFGCYLAAQCFFFAEHKKYIGVDNCTLKRFHTDNAAHYTKSIQDFIKDDFPKLQGDNLEYCAICSYVPDFEATEMVRKTFQNVFCFYPTSAKTEALPKERWQASTTTKMEN